MASIIKADTLQSTTSNVSILNSAGTEYARFDSTGVFQLANPTTFPAGTAALPSITATGDTNTGLYFPAADTIAFAEGGAEVARFNSSGNLGVGTASPAVRLHVSGSSTYVAGIEGSSTFALMGFKASGTTGTLDDANVAIGATGDALYFRAGGVERGRIDSSGNLQFNSGYGSVATAYGCRAWVNFNGTGTVAIRASGNVTDITDGGTGVYTVNFTTAMPDVNYSAVFGGVRPTTNYFIAGASSFATTSVIISTWSTVPAAVDYPTVCVSIFR
jgi:hypothetical protein